MTGYNIGSIYNNKGTFDLKLSTIKLRALKQLAAAKAASPSSSLESLADILKKALLTYNTN